MEAHATNCACPLIAELVSRRKKVPTPDRLTRKILIACNPFTLRQHYGDFAEVGRRRKYHAAPRPLFSIFISPISSLVFDVSIVIPDNGRCGTPMWGV